MLPLLLTITLLTSPVFDVYKVPDSYIQSAYQIADQKLELMDDEDIIEEDIVEDEIDDEIYSEEIPEDPEEDTEDYSVMALEDESSIIAELQKNNEYWNMFLDSYETVNHYDLTFHSSILGWKFSLNGSVSSSSSANDKISYVPVTKDQLYYVSSLVLGGSTTTDIRCGVVNDLYNPTAVTNFRLISYSNLDDFSFVSGQDGYLCFWHNPRVVEGLVSYDVSSFDSYTLSELGNAVMSLNQRVEDMTKYNNYELYSDAASLEASDMYINKYEFETFKLLRYLVILVACNIGAIFILLFSLRCRNGTS